MHRNIFSVDNLRISYCYIIIYNNSHARVFFFSIYIFFRSFYCRDIIVILIFINQVKLLSPVNSNIVDYVATSCFHPSKLCVPISLFSFNLLINSLVKPCYYGSMDPLLSSSWLSYVLYRPLYSLALRILLINR